MTACFVLCPGRGSYGRGELGSLGRLAAEGGERTRALLALLEAERARLDPDLPSLAELDGAPRFRPGLHLPGRNAAALIFAAGLLDAEIRLRDREPVLAGGNSLGFYTALAVTGVLEPAEGLRLVSTMARLQEGVRGGQLLWTLLDDDWQVVPERTALVEELLADGARRGELYLSIRLGGHVVLAGSEEGLRRAEERLPAVRLGRRDFPFRLAFHGPFHTPLARPVAERARAALADLEFRTPRIPLVDGRGYVWPTYGDPGQALKAYTLETQVTTPFDFTGLVRVGLLDYAPDEVLALAPGDSLRAPIGHVERFLDRASALPPLPAPTSGFPRGAALGT